MWHIFVRRISFITEPYGTGLPAFKKRPDAFPNVLMVLTVSSNEFLSPSSVSQYHLHIAKFFIQFLL